MNESRQEARDNRAARVKWLKENTSYSNSTALQHMTDQEVAKAHAEHH